MSENPHVVPKPNGERSISPAPKKTPRFWLIAIPVLIVGVAAALLIPLLRGPIVHTRLNDCRTNLRMIALALQIYHDDYHSFPPAYTVDANGKPLHSWRTLILPYLGEKSLYDSIDLAKPWDDPANAKACQTKVSGFACPSSDAPPNHTSYLACVAEGSCLRPGSGTRKSDLVDGAEQTLLLVEAPLGQSVPWMSPQDADESLILSIGANSKLPHKGGFLATFCDGHVQSLDPDLSAENRRALISIAGHDKASGFGE